MTADKTLRSTVAALGAVYLLVRGLAGGPVMHSDSYEYLNAATLVAEGKAWGSLDNSLEYFPPFYPMSLAAVMMAGASADRAAVVIGALVFGLNIFLAGYTVRRIGGSPAAAVAASLILMVSARSRLDHAEALSDPLFTLLCQVGLLGLIAFEESGSTKAMATAAAAAGLSMFTRFLGAATIIGAAVTLVLSAWQHHASSAARIRTAALGVVLCGLGSVPCLVWIGRNLSLHGVWAGGRELPIGDVSAQTGVTNLFADLGRYWSISVTPAWWHGAVGVIVVLAAVGSAALGRRLGFDRVRPHWIFVGVYGGGLLASAALLNPQWRSEYALPLFVAMNVLFVVGCQSLLSGRSKIG